MYNAVRKSAFLNFFSFSNKHKKVTKGYTNNGHDGNNKIMHKPPQQKQGNLSRIGLVGLAVMGQNLSLNIAEKGYTISVYNRSFEKTQLTSLRAEKEGLADKLFGYEDIHDFVSSLEKPRKVIILVQAGKPVDTTIEKLSQYMEEEDIIIDGGNEWYENTERRAIDLINECGIYYLGMGISGGEEGARNGPSMMPGGDYNAYLQVEDIVQNVSAKVDDIPCVSYIGPGGAGNFVKMVHNGIEYGDMQLISEAYDILKNIGGLNNEELSKIFEEWNNISELQSYLMEITSIILKKKDDLVEHKYQIDTILDKTGMKGTGKWTVQNAAELSIAIPTIGSSLEARFLAGLKDERVMVSKRFPNHNFVKMITPESQHRLKEDVKKALYVSKICSYAQGMSLIQKKSEVENWGVSLHEVAKIWKGGCIIRANLLDQISEAYERNPHLASLLMDDKFTEEIKEGEAAWRRVVSLSVTAGITMPSMTASLVYFDTYRRAKLPANLVQAQRDFFGSHTYERNDGKEGSYHTIWSDKNSSDSITTTGYNT